MIFMDSLAVFENLKIRRHFDEKTETWYFSVIDVVAVLIEQKDFKKAKSYWTTLKNRLKIEGSEVVTKCDQLKMKARDGKMTATLLSYTGGSLVRKFLWFWEPVFRCACV